MRLGEKLVDWGLRGYLVRAGLVAPACGEALDRQDKPVPVPWSDIPKGRVMVALVAGQSNAANGGQGPSPAVPGVFNLYGGQCYQARDPLLGASGAGGSPWVRLGRRLIEAGRFDAVILVPAAVGGTRIAHWSPGGELHPLLLSALDCVGAAGLAVTHMIWHQGESDAQYGTSQAAYAKALAAIIAGLRRRGMAAPVMVCRVATMRGVVNPAVRAAQDQVIAQIPGVVAGPDTDLLLGSDYRFDELHFSAAGLEAFADALYAALDGSLV